MNINLFKKIDDGFLAVFLTFTVIGLLFVLKYQEEQTPKTNYTSITEQSEVVTFVE